MSGSQGTAPVGTRCFTKMSACAKVGISQTFPSNQKVSPLPSGRVISRLRVSVAGRWGRNVPTLNRIHRVSAPATYLSDPLDRGRLHKAFFRDNDHINPPISLNSFFLSRLTSPQGGEITSPDARV